MKSNQNIRRGTSLRHTNRFHLLILCFHSATRACLHELCVCMKCVYSVRDKKKSSEKVFACLSWVEASRSIYVLTHATIMFNRSVRFHYNNEASPDRKCLRKRREPPCTRRESWSSSGREKMMWLNKMKILKWFFFTPPRCVLEIGRSSKLNIE
jgi:hypothetical protein